MNKLFTINIYASHGFMCYGKEGELPSSNFSNYYQTDMEKIHEKGRKKKQCVQ